MAFDSTDEYFEFRFHFIFKKKEMERDRKILNSVNVKKNKIKTYKTTKLAAIIQNKTKKKRKIMESILDIRIFKFFIQFFSIIYHRS